MQALILLPPASELGTEARPFSRLAEPVCGLGLLARTVATAARVGCDRILIVHPPSVPRRTVLAALDLRRTRGARVETAPAAASLDPRRPSNWRQIAPHLEESLLWLPWNFVVDKVRLREWIRRPEAKASVRTPGTARRAELLRNGLPEAAPAGAPGRSVLTKADRRIVENDLVRHSGKEWDGVFSRFNRRLCRPAVRWLSKTPVTPNAVTFAGLPAAVLAGYWFAQGSWAADVLGALFYFLTVLLDEIDGMLARVTYRESAFGCWLEAFVDYATYIPLFGGMAIGLYRQYGAVWLTLAGLLAVGVVMTAAVAVYHRRLACRLVRADLYVPEYYARLDGDSGSLISRFVRRTHFILKKGAFCHIVLGFSALGLLPVFFAMAAVGSNITWVLGLVTSRLLSRPAPGAA